MSALEAAVAADVTYTTKCHFCAEKFDALSARWCDCVAPLRTLQCPHCHSCFCHAPLPYKRKFWANAPVLLRQDARRFYVQLSGSPAAAIHERTIPPAGARRPLVLIVDDDESMKSLVACWVEQLGYRVLTAADPLEALDVVEQHNVDVVITDALMPKMDGREMCRRIKSTAAGASKKVIVMTSLYKSRLQRSEAVGHFRADAVIAKPLDLKALAALLDQLAPA